MPDNTQHTPSQNVLALEQAELLDLLLKSIARHGHGDVLRANPIEEAGGGTTVSVDRAALDAITRAHHVACSVHGDLAVSMAEVVADIVSSMTGINGDLCVLYTSVVCDALAHRNRHSIDWGEDCDQYEALIYGLNGSGPSDELVRWLREHLVSNTGAPLSAFILGAMTDAEHDDLEHVRAHAIQVKMLLEKHGYVVHAPCARGSSGRPRMVVVEDDLGQISAAALVIVLMQPPAFGAGILLGEAARSNPAVIFVAEPTASITPLAAIIGDPEPDRANYMTDDQMLDEVEAALRRKRPAVEALARERDQRFAEEAETFAEYAESYQYLLDAGVELVVPEVPEFRTRLICTQIESFAAATQKELRAICRALNQAVDDIADRDGDDGVGGPAQGDEPDSRDQQPAAGAPLEWDQPALFDGFTRTIEVPVEDTPDDFYTLNPLTKEELEAAKTANEVLHLSESDFDNLLYLAQLVRYEEARALETVSRVEFGMPSDWDAFYRVSLGRS